MKATEARLLNLLRKSPQFVIPIYQRTYSWTEKECQQLWDNFVDVVPQAKRLRLSINMPFAEVSDPKGLCKDVSSVGRWGNGDVEVGLTSFPGTTRSVSIPYPMALFTRIPMRGLLQFEGNPISRLFPCSVRLDGE